MGSWPRLHHQAWRIEPALLASGRARCRRTARARARAPAVREKRPSGPSPPPRTVSSRYSRWRVEPDVDAGERAVNAFRPRPPGVSRTPLRLGRRARVGDREAAPELDRPTADLRPVAPVTLSGLHQP